MLFFDKFSTHDNLTFFFYFVFFLSSISSSRLTFLQSCKNLKQQHRLKFQMTIIKLTFFPYKILLRTTCDKLSMHFLFYIFSMMVTYQKLFYPFNKYFRFQKIQTELPEHLQPRLPTNPFQFELKLKYETLNVLESTTKCFRLSM
jgi:hypothetical protein